jgi:hypothetical protein
MNYLTIEKLQDLDQLLMMDIYLTGKEKNQQDELRYNTWEISFSNKLIEQLTLDDLKKFIDVLIKRRSDQVKELDISEGATFYMWFDAMSFHLCFDILSGRNIKLPFGCKVHVVKSYEVILKKFFKEAKIAAEQDCHIPFENIKFLEPGDEGFGIEEDHEIDWTQDVYVTTLPF